MISAYWHLIGSRFSTEPLYTLFMTTDPPSASPENQALLQTPSLPQAINNFLFLITS